MRALFSVVLLFGCATGPVRQKIDALDDARAGIERAMRAGFLEHDLEGYLAIFTDDVQLVEGKNEAPGPDDKVLDRAQLEADKRERFKEPAAEGAVMEFAWKSATTNPDGSATLTVDTTYTRGDFVAAASEVYVVVNVDGVWRVSKNRFWSVPEVDL